MKNQKLFFFCFIIISSILVGCSKQESSNGSRKDITALQLKEMMQKNPDLVILDVRTKEELTGPLPKIQSAINIPLQQLDNRVDELEKYRGKNIYVICRTGHRSGIASEKLKKKGFNVVNVKGGMTDYMKN